MRLMRVIFEGLAVFFTALQFSCVERNRWLIVGDVVAGPLSRGWLEERVLKEILAVDVGCGRLVEAQRGRAVRRKCRVFDSTKGFPGEDVAIK